MLLTGALLVVAMVTSGAVALGQDEPLTPYQEVKAIQDQAKKAGAKGQLPHAWWAFDAKLKEAKDGSADVAVWSDLEEEARHLLNAALFVEEMRRQKSGMEAMLGRYDQSMLEIATLFGFVTSPELSGSGLAGQVQEMLGDRYLQRQVLIDSLTVENRRFNESLGDRAAAQESLITALQVEVTSLRKELWETELRVGVAEADRSAAESVLTRKQAHEEAVAMTRADIGTDEGEILLTAEGDIVMRVHGLSFEVGSADISAGQEPLLDKLVIAINRFPGAVVRIEGHTDDTGSRDANLRLSRRRAEAVARLLEIKMSREMQSMATEGFGPDRPIGPNSTAEGRTLNRRIDVVISPAN